MSQYTHKKIIGVMPQDNIMHENLTMKENFGSR